jgi:hypothetical protein
MMVLRNEDMKKRGRGVQKPLKKERKYGTTKSFNNCMFKAGIDFE